ncbi:hypothetical protein BGW37DRAFT_521834 [Umbelopsis sp. PMI_123]|nr:hypothetical protein BGW37DRAFT_521834 [Umbelopsis sp. PMI_123]
MYHDAEQCQNDLHNLISSHTININQNVLDSVLQISTHLLQCANNPLWHPLSLLLDQLAKRLKHEPYPTPLSETLRMVIYHHRALRYEADLFYEQAIVYYRKAHSVRVPADIPLAARTLKMSKASLDALTQARKHIYSSDSSDVENICVACGIEAERMPVCARCKRVRLCSLACVRKSDHKKLCKKRVTFA